MAKIAHLSAILAILNIFSSTLNGVVGHRHGTIIDITKYGAKPGSDITQALSRAWNEACVSPANDKVVIPKGDYLMGPLTLKGPCRGPIHLEVGGNIKAPADLDIANFRFNFLTNSVISGISSLNSKLFHMSLVGCKNLTLKKLNNYAEPKSVNTDGIHIGQSDGVHITDVAINTGDDCVSIGQETRQLYIEKVTYGQGHGLSIGSLEKHENEEDVSGVFIKNCPVKNADNGVRIKTWLNSFPTLAEELHFEDIVIENVTNLIVVDQAYCPYNHCKLKVPSKVKLSKVSFKNIRGSGSRPTAIKLLCSSRVPCEQVELADIDLTYNGNQLAVSECANIKPQTTGRINPLACTMVAEEFKTA